MNRTTAKVLLQKTGSEKVIDVPSDSLQFGPSVNSNEKLIEGSVVENKPPPSAKM
jgi:hypothetical protein